MERVWQKGLVNCAEVTIDKADGIVGFINDTGIRLKLGKLSPNAFRRESTSKKPIKVSEITKPPYHLQVQKYVSAMTRTALRISAVKGNSLGSARASRQPG